MPRRRSNFPRTFFSLIDGELAEESADFPDPRTAGEQGLLAIGGDLELETLRRAYRLGVFPWPQEGYPMMWFCPDPRGVLDFEKIHWPRRFLRELKDTSFEVTMDRAFADVVRACASAPRKPHVEEPQQDEPQVEENDSSDSGLEDAVDFEDALDEIAEADSGREPKTERRPAQLSTATWILPEMIDAYIEMHKAGDAHSFECWHEGKLVGGLYGVWMDGVFSGESMFHSVSGASKRCLHGLVTHLQSLGVKWMDTQMVTPILKSFGGSYISREEYLEWVASSQVRGLLWR